MKVFAILDVKANVFMKPHADKTTVDALRNFEIATNQKDTLFNRFPDDFCLMELADFDPQSGSISSHASPMNLGSARTVLRSEVVNVQ